MPAKVGIKLCRYARMCFICAYMDVPTQLKLCLYDQTQIVAIASCRVDSQQFLS